MRGEMASYLILVYVGAGTFFGCFIWDSIVDGTFRKKPSDWLGYLYLSTMVMVLGYGSKYLDEVRAHPYHASVIALVVIVLVGWLTVLTWRKAARWDKDYDNRQRTHSHHH
jgi:hypothetical protein